MAIGWGGGDWDEHLNIKAIPPRSEPMTLAEYGRSIVVAPKIAGDWSGEWYIVYDSLGENKK